MKKGTIMNRFFNMDSPFWQFMSKIGDLLILNIIFIISCIPIVTIGASISALYHMCFKILRKESPYVWKVYWKTFKENFKQSTIIWLFSLVIIYFLGMDYYLLISRETTNLAIVRIVFWIIAGLLFSMFIYIFPIISHFKCTLGQALKNSLYMTLGHLPFSILLVFIFGGILYLTTVSPKIFASIFVLAITCGCSFTAYIACALINRLFKRYEPNEEE